MPTERETCPTPYYSDDSCTIYFGDCREILPTLGTFDLLLTDPPYGIGESNEKNATRDTLAKTTDYGHYEWDKERISDEVITMLRSRCRNSVIFGGNYYDLPPASCWLVWDKDNGASDFADCELAWTDLKRAVRKFRWRWHGMLQERAGRHKEHRYHPTQKPRALMRWCMSLVPDADNIVDPFMGSGTTLVAAKLELRKATGIELNERYCEVAANRLRQGVLF